MPRTLVDGELGECLAIRRADKPQLVGESAMENEWAGPGFVELRALMRQRAGAEPGGSRQRALPWSANGGHRMPRGGSCLRNATNPG